MLMLKQLISCYLRGWGCSNLELNKRLTFRLTNYISSSGSPIKRFFGKHHYKKNAVSIPTCVSNLKEEIERFNQTQQSSLARRGDTTPSLLTTVERTVVANLAETTTTAHIIGAQTQTKYSKLTSRKILPLVIWYEPPFRVGRHSHW